MLRRLAPSIRYTASVNHTEQRRGCQGFYHIYFRHLLNGPSSVNIATVVTLRYTINVKTRPQISRRPIFSNP